MRVVNAETCHVVVILVAPHVEVIVVVVVVSAVVGVLAAVVAWLWWF